MPELGGARLPHPDPPKITLRQLLSHAEGFPEDNPWGDRQLARTDAWLDAAMRAGIPFSTAPGTTFEYSNYGFGILGRVVQNVAGEPYERTSSGDSRAARHDVDDFGMPEGGWPAPAHGYRYVDGRHEAEELLAHGAFGAMGGLWTSARDLAKYVAFLMSAFPPRDGPEPGPSGGRPLREMQAVARHTPTTVRRQALDGALQVNAGGYGFGLRISEDCGLGLNVGHGGGLPGYGSLMRWYPERGVGLVSMANLTYAGWGGVFNDVFEALRKTGGLTAQEPPFRPRAARGKRAVSDSVLDWDPAAADRLAADNLFLDESAERRRANIATLLERHGACRPDEKLEAENALRGRWRMTCERGRLEVGITLAPTVPPRVQWLNVRGVMPPGPSLQKVIDSVLSLMASWDTARAKALLDAKADVEQLSRQMALASLQAGACTQGETLVGDGVRALIALKCDRTELMVDVVLDTGVRAGEARQSDARPLAGVRAVSPVRFRFGPFLLSPRQRAMWRDGREVPLIPRYFDLLVLLLQKRHEAVHRSDIFATVWSDVVVSDGALTQAVRALRRALGDDPREPVYIRTVSRHGYRFVFAAVEEEPEDGPAHLTSASAPHGPATHAPAVAPTGGPRPAGRHPRRRSPRWRIRHLRHSPERAMGPSARGNGAGGTDVEALLAQLCSTSVTDEERREAAERLHASGTAAGARPAWRRPGHRAGAGDASGHSLGRARRRNGASLGIAQGLAPQCALVALRSAARVEARGRTLVVQRPRRGARRGVAGIAGGLSSVGAARGAGASDRGSGARGHRCARGRRGRRRSRGRAVRDGGHRPFQPGPAAHAGRCARRPPRRHRRTLADTVDAPGVVRAHAGRVRGFARGAAARRRVRTRLRLGDS